MLCAIGGLSLPLCAGATPRVDVSYIHCDNGGGDFSVSELNHSVAQYSERYQEYRRVCVECDVTEWGDRITMKDGLKTFVQINRLTGFVLVQRNSIKSTGPFETYSFQGKCHKAAMVTPKSRGAPSNRVL